MSPFFAADLHQHETHKKECIMSHNAVTVAVGHSPPSKNYIVSYLQSILTIESPSSIA
ncbi:LOW QUALITY PROTEIN: hypothetical protein RvY_02112 [Ramazzottius varieornatus]|uniref:Uncharacterized protein n=1 Tax=Ramazzottius varieornatus TaxID=947166 RepID=A0A1D1UQN0_RAMVA|nr:LOW QUALITY PROTEIN: hypothetical protein RvY_02112 [Ramazzottius varieornatus]